MGAYSQRISRRTFVAGTSSFAAVHSVSNFLPSRPPVAALQNDSRLSQTVVADKGFAAVRRVGNDLYATISDTTKGLQTMCNGGLLAGKEFYNQVLTSRHALARVVPIRNQSSGKGANLKMTYVRLSNRAAITQESPSTLHPDSHAETGSRSAPIPAARRAPLPTMSPPFRPSPASARKLAP
jgi:hypothetical protein